jgi:hypothetical protein
MRLSQNFSFGTATIDLMEKTAVRRFFQELVTKLTEFWDKLRLPFFLKKSKLGLRKEAEGSASLKTI